MKELTKEQLIARDWVFNAKNGAKKDTALIGVILDMVKDVNADGSTKFFPRMGNAEKTAFDLFRSEVQITLDSLIESSMNSTIAKLFPSKIKGTQIQHPSFGRLRLLRSQVLGQACKLAGIDKKTGMVTPPTTTDDNEGEDKEGAMKKQSGLIAEAIKSLNYSLDDAIAIVENALAMLKAEAEANTEA